MEEAPVHVREAEVVAVPGRVDAIEEAGELPLVRLVEGRDRAEAEREAVRHQPPRLHRALQVLGEEPPARDVVLGVDLEPAHLVGTALEERLRQVVPQAEPDAFDRLHHLLENMAL